MALPSINLDIDHVVNCLNADGIYMSRGLLGEETVRKLNDEFDLLLAHEFKGVKQSKQRGRGRSFRVKYKSLENGTLPACREVFFCENFKSIASKYMPSGSRINSDLVGTYDDKYPSFIFDHFDTLRALKFMIYLLDTNQENGAFCYARGTQIDNAQLRRRHFRFGGSCESLPKVLVRGDFVSQESFTGPAGTVIIFDTEGFHRAGKMADGTTRRIIRSRCLFPNQPIKHPKKFSRQWFWEHRLNPVRIFAPKAPAHLHSTSEGARGRAAQLRRAGCAAACPWPQGGPAPQPGSWRGLDPGG